MNAPTLGSLAIPQRLDYHDICKLLPYKSPWLLIDRVASWGTNEIVVIKAISGAEVNMAAHMAQGPSVAPGVLQIELVNQALMLLMVLLNMSGVRSDSMEGGAGVLASCKAKFHSPAFIGDVITATVKVIDTVGNKTMFEGEITCGDRRVATVSCIGATVPVQAVFVPEF